MRKNKKRMYLIQGTSFPVHQIHSKGYMPKAKVTESKVVFSALICIDPEENISEGGMVEHDGKFVLTNVVVSGSEILFKRRTIRKGPSINPEEIPVDYILRKTTSKYWIGSYDHPVTGRGIVRCIVSPIEDTFFTRPESLNGLPFIGEVVDYAQKYKWHKKSPNAQIPFSPKSGITERKCSNCFYRNYKGAINNDCHCGEKGNNAKKTFGIPEEEHMPEQIDGQEVGHFCPHWVDPMAD